MSDRFVVEGRLMEIRLHLVEADVPDMSVPQLDVCVDVRAVWRGQEPVADWRLLFAPEDGWVRFEGEETLLTPALRVGKPASFLVRREGFTWRVDAIDTTSRSVAQPPSAEAIPAAPPLPRRAPTPLPATRRSSVR